MKEVYFGRCKVEDLILKMIICIYTKQYLSSSGIGRKSIDQIYKTIHLTDQIAQNF